MYICIAAECESRLLVAMLAGGVRARVHSAAMLK